MSYTSGRTVKSSRPARPTTVSGATADARKLVTRHLPGVSGVQIRSHLGADPVTLAPWIVTVVTAPLSAELADFAHAATKLPGFADMKLAEGHISITRTA